MTIENEVSHMVNYERDCIIIKGAILFDDEMSFGRFRGQINTQVGYFIIFT